MKKVLSIILVMILAVSIGTTGFAAEAAKVSEANPYTFKEIPASWIKQTKKDNVVTGYTITVANNKKATLKLSGTQFKEYSVKGKDGKFGKAVALTNGKLRTVKDISVIRVVLRDKAEKKSASDIAKVNVDTHYQSGMSWGEVRASLNELVGPAYSIAESGNLTQDDGVSPTNINVISTNSGYKIHITGWRRDKNSDAVTNAILKKTQTIFAFFYGNSAGNAAFNWYDAMMTGGSADTDDFGITGTDLGGGKYRLTHNKSGISFTYVQGNGSDAFYVG